jgi:hypothetical protein
MQDFPLKRSVKFITLHGIISQKIGLNQQSRRLDDRWIGKDLKGNGCALINVFPFQYLFGETEVYRPGFEPSISRVRVRSLTATLTCTEVLTTVRNSNLTFLYQIIELYSQICLMLFFGLRIGRRCFAVNKKPCKV